MNSEGIRLPPKPACQPSSALFKTTQLDLTPEKQTSQTTARSKLNSQTRASVPIQKGSQQRHETCSSLAQPSINSSKRVSEKLMAIRNEQFNAAAAIAKELENSVTARADLGEKVAQAVNVKKGINLYSDLVSMDVDTDEILSECAPRKARSAARTSKPLVQEPDIMAFFSEDFESEMASFDFDAFYREDSSPATSNAPISHAFDLYRHIQCWQQP